MLIEIILGILIAIISVFLIARLYPNRDHAFWRVGLIVAALIYVLFALLRNGISYLPLELGGLFFYGIFVWLSKRKALYWLAVGWGLHIGWDILLHTNPAMPFVPSWYPGVCLGFDIVIALYIFRIYQQRQEVLLQ